MENGNGRPWPTRKTSIKKDQAFSSNKSSQRQDLFRCIINAKR